MTKENHQMTFSSSSRTSIRCNKDTFALKRIINKSFLGFFFSHSYEQKFYILFVMSHEMHRQESEMHLYIGKVKWLNLQDSKYPAPSIFLGCFLIPEESSMVEPFGLSMETQTSGCWPCLLQPVLGNPRHSTSSRNQT